MEKQHFTRSPIVAPFFCWIFPKPKTHSRFWSCDRAPCNFQYPQRTFSTTSEGRGKSWMTVSWTVQKSCCVSQDWQFYPWYHLPDWKAILLKKLRRDVLPSRERVKRDVSFSKIFQCFSIILFFFPPREGSTQILYIESLCHGCQQRQAETIHWHHPSEYVFLLLIQQS